MSEPTGYTPGTPCWVDLASSDLEASAAFYGGLFGWELVAPAADDEETGGYRLFTLGGKRVAGIGPVQAEGSPPAWTVYVATDDAAATAGRVRDNGGGVLMEPMAVTDAGVGAVFSDPGGAVWGVWQPGHHRGAELINEPGALSWNELMTRDVEEAKAFYGAVLGWGLEFTPMDGVDYGLWQLDGKPIAGLMPMAGDTWPADLPPHWMVYLEVADCDASAAKAGELGGVVSVAPTDIAGAGRLAVLSDPQGAFFSIITSDQPEE